MNPLNVLIAGLNYAPESAGIAPYTTGLANGLSDRGHRVRVLTGLPHYPQWAIAPGYEKGRVTADDGKPEVNHLVHHVPPPGSLRGRLRMELSYGRRLACASWGEPDVVVCVSPALFAAGMAIARAKTMPRRPGVGLWVHDLYGIGVVETETLGAHSASALSAVESAILKSADRIAVIHERFKSRVVADLDISPSDVSVIRNWTHVQPSDARMRPDARRRLGWAPDEIVALHAGNMGAKQGLENVIAAGQIAQQRGLPVRFVLLGDGNQRAHLELMSRTIKTVQLVAPLPDPEYRAALLAADVLLVNEKAGVGNMALPSKLTSYFTSGNPVVAATGADSITAAEIHASGGGLVTAPDDPAKLLAAVVRLGKDRDLACRLGRAGLRFRSHTLSMTHALDEFEQWIGQLASVSNRTPAPTTKGHSLDDENSSHNRHYRTRRLLPGRTAPAKGLRGTRFDPSILELQHGQD
ncbi:glycosyltransferase family 4 protein [soil metagenome]